MRIAVLTFHRAYNCGAMLQAWALRMVLERMGHTVEFPICNHVGESDRWRVKWIDLEKRGVNFIRSVIGRFLLNIFSVPSEDILRMRYKRFRQCFLPERFCDVVDLSKNYDLLIVGSDQVWSERHSLSDSPLFFGESLPLEVKKITYAASYGDKPLDGNVLKRVVDAVSRFSKVSVREPLAQKQLTEFTTQKIDVVADPTLLLTEEDYCVLSDNIKVPNEPYLFMYTLSSDKFFVNTARALARRLKVKCIIAPCYQYSRFGAPIGLTYSISPDRLVALARGAKYVLAGSFHGTVMGVIFNKPFLSLRAQVDEYESRPAALLNRIGCSERLVTPMTSLEKMESLLKMNVPKEAYDRLNVFKEESLAWLKSSLDFKS
jgi:hypothetical protein